MAKSKEVTKKEDSSQEMVETNFDYGEYEGAGFEDVSSSDLSIPFLNILQPLSPAVVDEQIEGAEAGNILNTVTGELLTEFNFLPVHRDEQWVEWKPRVKGGGFVGLHDPRSEEVQGLIADNEGSRIPPVGADGKRKAFSLNGGETEIIETYYMYGLILNKEGTEVTGFGIMSFTSTKIKAYKDWLTSMFMLKGKPPIFANRARIKTVRQKNESGVYYIYQIMPLKSTWSESLITDTDLLRQAVDFREMVLSGKAKANFEQQDTSGPADAGAAAGSEDAPF